MKVIFRNFLRNKMVNLSATSIRHFLPEIEIHCLTLFKKNMSDYDNQEPLHDYIIEHVSQTKYVSGIDVHDSTEYGTTSGFANPCNGIYFTEGFNLIHKLFKDSSEPILILGEDHYFSSGQTLRELVNTDGQWDVAYGDWDSWGEHLRANGSILAIVPNKVSHLFPLQEIGGSVEDQVGEFLLKYILENRLHKLSTRAALWYGNDGSYTNSSEEMISELKKVGIL